MFTIIIWKNLIEYIKDTKNILNGKKIKNEIKWLWDEDKMLATLKLIALSIGTPLLLLFDICVIPLELLYLLVYKFLWGGK